MNTTVSQCFFFFPTTQIEGTAAKHSGVKEKSTKCLGPPQCAGTTSMWWCFYKRDEHHPPLLLNSFYFDVKVKTVLIRLIITEKERFLIVSYRYR